MVVYAPQLIPTTMLGLIGTLAVAVAAVFAALSSVAQILDTLDRKRAERAEEAALLDKERVAHETYCLYRDSVLRFCDVVDLTELPVLDATLTMQEFTIRQLYIPLRLLTDRPAGSAAAATETDAGPNRNFQRSVAEGRNDERHQLSPTVQEEVSIGSLLNEHTHIIILGEPGSGKSTLAKWLALALILREKNSLDAKQFPDWAAIPQQEGWVPILVRCRDILEHQAVQVLGDLIAQSLQFRSRSPEKQQVLSDYLNAKVNDRKALLIIDGLDEIRDTQVRTSFARRVQEIARQHRELPMVITSRKVGYKEMRSRLGAQFKQAEIAELKKSDKEKFARDWCRAAVPEVDREQQTASLLAAIDSTEDIKRITSSALLLTILAIVLRKLHRLPHRRAELYRYFMQVLFDFNPTVYNHVDAREAVDQLSYLAYAMEKEGTSPIDEDRLLKHLADMRGVYQTPAINRHSPQEFIEEIQRQTSIIVHKGYRREGAKEVALYEFKHETFMHYFAGLALVNNIYPDCRRGTQLGDRVKSVFEHRVPVTLRVRGLRPLTEWTVKENWREILRLSIASAGLNDADCALAAMLDLPADSVEECDRPLLARMGAVTAALCLADEPNVSVQAGRRVVETLMTKFLSGDGFGDKVSTSLDEAAVALTSSQEWRQHADEEILKSLETYPGYDASAFGSLYLLSHPEVFAPNDRLTPDARAALREDLRSGDRLRVIRACLKLVNMLYRDSVLEDLAVDTELTDALFESVARSHVERLVAVWALAWFWDRYYLKNLEKSLSAAHTQLLSAHLLDDTHPYVLRAICDIVGASHAEGADFIYIWAVAADTGVLDSPPMKPAPHKLDAAVIDRLRSLLKNPERKLRAGAAIALARLGVSDDESVAVALDAMNDASASSYARDFAVEALVRVGGKRVIDSLLAQLESDDEYVRFRSMLALIGIDSDETVSGLCGRLRSDSPHAREFAAAGLTVHAKNGNVTVIEALKQALSVEAEKEPQGEIARVLRVAGQQV